MAVVSLNSKDFVFLLKDCILALSVFCVCRKGDVRINLSKARHSSSVENQTHGTHTVYSESERSQQSSSELLRSSEKFQYFGETEAQKSRAAHDDEESFVYKSRGLCSTKEGHRKSRDINEVKYSDYLENANSSESKKYQRPTFNKSDKAIVIKKASKERHRNWQIGLGRLKSDSRIKDLDENDDPVYCGDSDASGRADGKAAQSADRHIVEIPSSTDDDEVKYELPKKRMKYVSDDIDDATRDSEKKFYSGKTSKTDRYYGEIASTEQEKVVACSNVSERSRSSSDNSTNRSLPKEEKCQPGRRIRRSERNAQCASITQKQSGERRKVEKQNANSKNASKENSSRDASQQSKEAPQLQLLSSKRKYRRSVESQSTTGSEEEEATSVHSKHSYFKGNRSPSTSSLSSGHRSVSSRRKRRRRTLGRRRSSSSSRSPERSKRPSRCRSSRSISTIHSSSSSRSRSWKSSRSRERSLTSETFSPRSLRSDSKSKQKTGDRSKTRRPSNLNDGSSVNTARMTTTTASMPSLLVFLLL